MRIATVDRFSPPGASSSGAAAKQDLAWPAGVQPTRVRLMWYYRVRALPAGMDLGAIAAKFGVSKSNAHRWTHVFGYRTSDLRCRNGGLEKWDEVDWSLRDADIARRLGVSRERVRQVRNERRFAPSRSTFAHRRINPRRA